MIKQGIPAAKILMNGYTKLDPLFIDFNQKKSSPDKVTVLAAFSHNASTKVPEYERLLKTLEMNSNEINIIDVCHPAINRYSMTYDQYRMADVVISDCSSTLYEAWALGIPVVFPDWLVKGNIGKEYPDSFEELIFDEGIGFHASCIEEMMKSIYVAKEQGLDNQTKEFIEGIFPSELRGTSGKVTAQMPLEIANA